MTTYTLIFITYVWTTGAPAVDERVELPGFQTRAECLEAGHEMQAATELQSSMACVEGR